MKNFIIRMYNGIVNVLVTSCLLYFSILQIQEVKLLNGYEAGEKLIIGILGVIMAFFMIYTVGKYEQEYKKQEREKKLNLSKINHDSLCKTETYKVDGSDGK